MRLKALTRLPPDERQAGARGRSLSDTVGVTTALTIIVTVLVCIPIVAVLYVFVWAAKKDGEEDKAVQRRLGIRRKTRLGR